MELLFPPIVEDVQPSRNYCYWWLTSFIVVVAAIVIWLSINSGQPTLKNQLRSQQQVTEREILPVATITSHNIGNKKSIAEAIESADDLQLISGTGKIGRELAFKVSELLQSIPDIEFQAPYPEIEILGLTEELAEHGMVSSLDVAVSTCRLIQHKSQKTPSEKTVSAFTLSLQGQGSIEKALPQMAKQLVAYWHTLLVSDDGVADSDKTMRGFE